MTNPVAKYRMMLTAYVKGDRVEAEEVGFAIKKGRGRVESFSERGTAGGVRELAFVVGLDEARLAEGILDSLEAIGGVVALRFSPPRRVRELRRA